MYMCVCGMGRTLILDDREPDGECIGCGAVGVAGGQCLSCGAPVEYRWSLGMARSTTTLGELGELMVLAGMSRSEVCVS